MCIIKLCDVTALFDILEREINTNVPFCDHIYHCCMFCFVFSNGNFIGFSFSCRSLLVPFCSTSPLCGSFQIYRYPEVQEAILDVIHTGIDIRDSRQSETYCIIKRYAPIIADGIVKNMINDKLDPYVARVLDYIVVSTIEMFSDFVIPKQTRYGTASDSPYEYFPSFPPTLGKSYYTADKERKTDSFCRKVSGSHPTLSPGIFTVFCRHGVCFGFSLMTSSESPRTPFSIFMRRFENFLPQLRIV